MMSDMQKRAEERRKRIVANRALNFQEAEEWDLEFWQQQGPEARLSALVAIHRDVALVQASREKKPEE